MAGGCEKSPIRKRTFSGIKVWQRSFLFGIIIHLENDDYHMYESLDVLEEKLKAYGFLRVHQSYLVNIRHIRSINNYVLVLDTGEEMKVPKARYKQVKQERALYMGKSL